MIYALGEILLRFHASEQKRFVQAEKYELNSGGAEANVVAALAQWGHDTSMISAVADSELGQLAVRNLNKLGVNTGQILRHSGRMGLYFLETGVSTRGGKVIYDRADSVFSRSQRSQWPKNLLKNASWFHWSGITPAVSRSAYELNAAVIKEARELGVPVSVDLNYRANLWSWGQSPVEVCPDMVRNASVLITNEEATEKMLGMSVPENEDALESGYRTMCEQLMYEYANLEWVFVPIRRTVSASVNRINLAIYHKGQLTMGNWFELSNIVDRVGAGDAMTAAIIHGIKSGLLIDEIAGLGIAASALKHSIPGDTLFASIEEVVGLMQGDKIKISR